MSQLGEDDLSSEGDLTGLAHTVIASAGRVEMSSGYAQGNRLDQFIAETIPKAHGRLPRRGDSALALAMVSPAIKLSAPC